MANVHTANYNLLVIQFEMTFNNDIVQHFAQYEHEAIQVVEKLDNLTIPSLVEAFMCKQRMAFHDSVIEYNICLSILPLSRE